MKEYPTLWQRKMMWAALTACFVDVIYRFDQTFGLLGAGESKSASKNLTNFLIGPGPSPSPHRETTASPTGSPQPTAPSPQVIAPTQPKLSSAERQRIQAYVEKQ